VTKNLLVIRKLDAYSVPALKQHTKIQDNLIPPTPERIVRLFVRQALLFLSLIAVIAFPCFSQRQTSFDKSASLRASHVVAFSFMRRACRRFASSKHSRTIRLREPKALTIAISPTGGSHSNGPGNNPLALGHYQQQLQENNSCEKDIS
jgi:hypothetical protein